MERRVWIWTKFQFKMSRAWSSTKRQPSFRKELGLSLKWYLPIWFGNDTKEVLTKSINFCIIKQKGNKTPKKVSTKYRKNLWFIPVATSIISKPSVEISKKHSSIKWKEWRAWEFFLLKNLIQNREIYLGIFICWHITKGHSYSSCRFSVNHVIVIPANMASLHSKAQSLTTYHKLSTSRDMQWSR